MASEFGEVVVQLITRQVEEARRLRLRMQYPEENHITEAFDGSRGKQTCERGDLVGHESWFNLFRQI